MTLKFLFPAGRKGCIYLCLVCIIYTLAQWIQYILPVQWHFFWVQQSHFRYVFRIIRRYITSSFNQSAWEIFILYCSPQKLCLFYVAYWPHMHNAMARRNVVLQEIRANCPTPLPQQWTPEGGSLRIRANCYMNITLVGYTFRFLVIPPPRFVATINIFID